MLTGMSNAQAVQMIAIMFVIAVVSILVLVIASALFPERLAPSWARVAAWAPGELGDPATFREPADESYVDELIRVRGRFPVVHRPDPLELAGSVADLIEGSRYVVPALPTHKPSAPAAHAEVVGRHRAPLELVAA